MHKANGCKFACFVEADIPFGKEIKPICISLFFEDWLEWALEVEHDKLSTAGREAIAV